MSMSLQPRILLGLAVGALTACASSTQSTAGPADTSPAGEAGTLRVANRSSTDMDVYVVRAGQRVRIGLAPGGETTSFALTTALMAGGGTVHFEAIPTRSAPGVSTGIRSDPATPRRGQIITLDVPPQ
jgi:uncharacterized protein YceK